MSCLRRAFFTRSRLQVVFNTTETARTSLALACAALALAGCGEAAAERSSAPATPAQPRLAADRLASSSGDESPSQAQRLFSGDSIWNRKLTPEAQVDPSSPELVSALTSEVAREEGERAGPWINTTSYGVPILTVPATQPTVPVELDHAPDKALSSAWSAVPLPANAQPSSGSDGYLVVWQPSSDRMWEFWQLAHGEGGWSASWGGAIDHVSRDPGVYGPSAWPGAKPWWGATASSLALAAGVMTIEELQAGRIEHALSIALPDIRAGVFASPAQRTDGSSSDPLALPEGAHLRIDPHLDLASLNMPPLVLAMAVAAQRYGIVVRDYASNIAFFGQDPTSSEGDPYRGASGLFAGEEPDQLLASFPWAHLQVLKMQLHPNP